MPIFISYICMVILASQMFMMGSTIGYIEQIWSISFCNLVQVELSALMCTCV